MIPEDPREPYDMCQVLRLVADNKEFFEVMDQYAIEYHNWIYEIE